MIDQLFGQRPTAEPMQVRAVSGTLLAEFGEEELADLWLRKAITGPMLFLFGGN